MTGLGVVIQGRVVSDDQVQCIIGIFGSAELTAGLGDTGGFPALQILQSYDCIYNRSLTHQ